jgi:hypothetical protein
MTRNATNIDAKSDSVKDETAYNAAQKALDALSQGDLSKIILPAINTHKKQCAENIKLYTDSTFQWQGVTIGEALEIATNFLGHRTTNALNHDKYRHFVTMPKGEFKPSTENNRTPIVVSAKDFISPPTSGRTRTHESIRREEAVRLQNEMLNRLVARGMTREEAIKIVIGV